MNRHSDERIKATGTNAQQREQASLLHREMEKSILAVTIHTPTRK
jgi:hypothetical protein